MNSNNKAILKVLRTKIENITDKDIETMNALGIEVKLEKTWSEQGYVALIKNGKELVISKDYDNLTCLFDDYGRVARHSQLKYVDFENYFNKDFSYKENRRQRFAPQDRFSELKSALQTKRFREDMVKKVREDLLDYQKRAQEQLKRHCEEIEKANNTIQSLKK